MQTELENYKILEVISRREDFTFFRVELNGEKYILKRVNPSIEGFYEKYVLVEFLTCCYLFFGPCSGVLKRHEKWQSRCRSRC